MLSSLILLYCLLMSVDTAKNPTGFYNKAFNQNKKCNQCDRSPELIAQFNRLRKMSKEELAQEILLMGEEFKNREDITSNYHNESFSNAYQKNSSNSFVVVRIPPSYRI